MGTPKRVLIVDDSLSMRLMTRKRLESAGFVIVAEAGDGKSGVDAFLESAPDIVLLDLIMPIMTGQEAMGAILSSDPTAKVIICSSMGNEDELERCLAAGALAYLQKPVDADDLVRVLTTLGA